MHKSNTKNKNWVGLFLILVLSILIIGTNNDVYAKNSCKYKYGVDVKIETDDSGESIKKVVITDSGRNSDAKYYVMLLKRHELTEKEATDGTTQQKKKVKELIASDTSKDSFTSSYTVNKSIIKNDYTIKGSNNADFYLLVYADVSEDDDCSLWYDLTHVELNEESGDGDIDSVNYNSSVCEWARSFANDSNVDSRMREILTNSMTPCFKQNSYNMTLANLEKIQSYVKEFYDNYYSKYVQEVGATKLPEMTSPWVKVDNTDLTGKYSSLGSNSNKMLTCNNKDEKTYQYLYYDHDESKIANITLGDGTVDRATTTNVKACTTTCREQLAVSYGPPKAVIAGQCFTYEVEVKSKVTCVVSDINFDSFPKFENYVPCEVHAVCSNTVGYEEQAGPNEKFDSCVNSCDGGKYTQSCIDSCYNKVYNNNDDNDETNTTEGNSLDLNTTTNTSNYNNNQDDNVNRKLYSIDTITLATRMADLTHGSKAMTSGCADLFDDPKSNPGIIDKIYEYVNQNITGNYIKTGSMINYSPKKATCEWSRYGYSYFRDKRIATRTVCNAYGYNYYAGATTCGDIDYAACYADSSCYPGRRGVATGYNAYYYPSSANSKTSGNNGVIGIKRSSSCGEKCEWKNTNHSYTGGACHYIDREAAEKDYVTNVKKYVDALGGCLSTAIDNCDKETTSNYTMSVNKDITDSSSSQTCDSNNYDSNGNCITWNSSHDKITKYDNTSLNDNSILKYVGGSCTTADDKENMYHSILTFPGAWINNKNGEVVYDKKDIKNEKWYTNYPGNYCTPLTAKNVNATWWTWYQYNKAGKITQDFETWAGSKAKDIVYNIFSKVNKFGRYNWNFDVACYYAVNDYSNNPGNDPDPNISEIPDPSTCTNTKCPNTEITTKNDTGSNNYTSKSISTTTMFPQTRTSSINDKSVSATKLSYIDKVVDTNVSSSSRTEGFNWSADATNLSIKGYPVTPSSLVKKIESTDAYQESEVDYDITLSTTNISNIKKLANNSEFSYTSYDDGSYESINNSYKSKYLTVKNSDNSNKYSDGNIPNFSYYRSDFIRDSKYVSTVTTAPKFGGLSCNNLKSSTSCDFLEEYTSQDSELLSFLSSVR